MARPGSSASLPPGGGSRGQAPRPPRPAAPACPPAGSAMLGPRPPGPPRRPGGQGLGSRRREGPGGRAGPGGCGADPLSGWAACPGWFVGPRRRDGEWGELGLGSGWDAASRGRARQSPEVQRREPETTTARGEGWPEDQPQGWAGRSGAGGDWGLRAAGWSPLNPSHGPGSHPPLPPGSIQTSRTRVGGAQAGPAILDPRQLFVRLTVHRL